MACSKYYGCDFSGMNLECSTSRFVALLGEAGVRENEPMSAHTTFKTGGAVDLMLFPDREESLVSIFHILRDAQVPYYVIGRGSNLLVSDKGLHGVVIKLADRMGKVFVQRNKVIAQAGASLHTVCMEAVRAGLSGLEFASGIPGTLGGAVAMNAGAYGNEIGDFITSVHVLDQNCDILCLSAKDLMFSYRHSIVAEQKLIVLSAEFYLPEGDAQESIQKISELNARRREKQPLNYPSAGSTFKRPQGHFAGALIEQCGLKGFSIGGAQVSEKHAGFIINTGNACSRDIYELILYVQNIVLEQTGVLLEPEVKMLGDFK